MHFSNSIGRGYPDWNSGRAARAGLPARVEQTSRADEAQASAGQAEAAGDAQPSSPLSSPTNPGVDEALVRGRLMDGGGSLSSRRAVSHYAAVAAQQAQSPLIEVVGVDTYA